MNTKPLMLLLLAAFVPLSSASLLSTASTTPVVVVDGVADTGIPALDTPFVAPRAAAAVPDSCQKWGVFFIEGGLYCNHAKCMAGDYEHWVGVYMSNLGYVAAAINCVDSNGNVRDSASCSAVIECFARATRALTVDHQMECSAAGASPAVVFGLVMNCFNVPGCPECDLLSTPTTSSSRLDVSSVDLTVLRAPSLDAGLCMSAGCLDVAPNSAGMLVNQDAAFGYSCDDKDCVVVPVLCLRADAKTFDCKIV